MRLLVLSVVALSLFGQGQGMGQGGNAGGTTVNLDYLTPEDIANNFNIIGIGQVGEGPVNGNGNRNGTGLTDYDWCFVSGDPHQCSYRQECASLRLPCRFHMTRLLVKASFDVFVGLNVYVTGGEPYLGRFYVDCVEIQVQIYDESGVGNLVERVDGYGVFTTCSSDVENARANNLDECWDKTNGDNQNTTLTYYDYENDMCVLTFYENGAAFIFRPVNRSEGIPQSRRPGVISLVTQDLAPDNAALFPATLCSRRTDNKPYRVRANQFNVDSTAQLLTYAVLGQNISQPLPECAAAADSFQNDCSTDAEKSAAVTTCHKLTNRRYVDCQATNGDSSGLGYFSECIVGMCTGTPNVTILYDNAETACPV